MRNHDSYRFARKAAARDAGINWRDSTDKYTKGKVRYRPVRATAHQPHQGDRQRARYGAISAGLAALEAAREAERLAALKKVRKPAKPRVRKAPVAAVA